MADAQLPLDENVKVPDAIKRRSAAVDAFYADQAKQAQQVPQPEPLKSELLAATPSAQTPQAASTEVVPPRPLETPPADTSAPTPPTPPTNGQAHVESEETYRAKFERANQQYAAEERRNREMQAQMAQMGEELMRTNELLNRRTEPPPPPQYYLTEKDEANFGPEMLDFATRAAKHAIAPELQRIKEQNEALQRRLSQASKQSLDQAVEAGVPNYREIDRNPRWLQWLSLPEPFSGRIRQHLLDEAIAASNAPRVIHFFRGFLNEEAATGHIAPAVPGPVTAPPPREPAIPLASLAAPGRTQPATGTEPGQQGEKPLYHRADITRAHRAYMQGYYRGREQEYEALQREFIRAQNEGRLLG